MVIIIIAIVVIVAALVAAIFIWKVQKKNKSKEFMSFMESMNLTNLPVVTFTVKGKKLNFLLDTGCIISIITQELVSVLNPKMLDVRSNVFGMEGNSVECGMCMLELEYKGGTYPDYFQILDMQNSFSKIKQESGVNVHGIIGTKFFQRYKSVLDFDELKAYFQK